EAAPASAAGSRSTGSRSIWRGLPAARRFRSTAGAAAFGYPHRDSDLLRVGCACDAAAAAALVQRGFARGLRRGLKLSSACALRGAVRSNTGLLHRGRIGVVPRFVGTAQRTDELRSDGLNGALQAIAPTWLIPRSTYARDARAGDDLLASHDLEVDRA